MDTPDRNRAALVVLLVLFSIIVIALKFKVSTDLKLFLPEPSNYSERLLHQQLDSGATTRLVFIALSGLPPEQLAVANKALAEKLESSDLYARVINQSTALGAEALEYVVENRYLLSRRDLQQVFTADGLNDALEARLEGLTGPAAALEKRFLRQDPSGEVLALLEDWQGKLSKHSRPEQRDGVWFSRDFERSLLLAEIGVPVTRLENQVKAIEEIRVAYEEIMQPGLQMTLTGPSAFAVESGEDIRNDVRTLTWLAVSLVSLFLLLVYRSVVMLLLVITPLAVGVVVATAGILLVHGQIHGITLAFGITLAGVAVDYPIHLLTGLTRQQENRSAYVDHIWPTLRLGVFSTVIAYAAFLVSGFGGLQQLGQFTITGLLVAALFSRWVLPLLLHNRGLTRQGLHWLHDVLTWLARRMQKLRLLVPVAAVSALAALSLIDKPVLHLDVDSLSPIKDARRAQGRMVREDLGYWYGGRLMVVSGNNKEAVLARSEELEPALDELMHQDVFTGFDMASQFLPSVARQQRNLAALADSDEVIANLHQALEQSSFKAGVFNPFEQQLPDLAQAAPIQVDMLMEKDFGRRLEPLIFDFDGAAAGVILLHGVTDEAALERFADKHDFVIYMHLKSAATDLVAHSVDRVSLIMIGCILAIYLLLAWSFGSLLRPLRVMVPTIAAAIVTAGLLVVFNNPLSIFHLISLMLVLGLGLDYALFFDRLPDNVNEWNTTFKSLWICGCTTVLVFGILVVSQTPPLRAIGMTVGLGATLSILFAAMWAAADRKA